MLKFSLFAMLAVVGVMLVSQSPANATHYFLTTTPSAEPEDAIALALAGVTSNNAWTPYSEEMDGVAMMLVPKGCFVMGSDGGNAQPAHEQCFDAPFWIDETEVTRAMYQACISADACTETLESDFSFRDTQPITRVTWFQAQEYCQWRDSRLPTEREWEYVARGPDNLEYPWGNDFIADNIAFDDRVGDETGDVGSRPDGASWVGALDISGNVWEWVSTIYTEPYPYSDEWENHEDTDSSRGLRGGSSSSVISGVRSTYRNGFSPDNENEVVGFRCARDFE